MEKITLANVFFISLLLVLSLTSCSNSDENSDSITMLDNSAPEFALRTPDGVLVNLSDFRGKPILINFWTTWCGPCRAEMPEIQALYSKYSSKGLVVLGINSQELFSDVKNYGEELSLEFPLLLDDTGEVSSSYRVHAFPSSFFIDSSGIIRYIQIGSMSKDEIEENIALIME